MEEKTYDFGAVVPLASRTGFFCSLLLEFYCQVNIINKELNNERKNVRFRGLSCSAPPVACCLLRRSAPRCALYLTKVAEVQWSGEECVGDGTVEVVASMWWGELSLVVTKFNSVWLVHKIFEVRSPSPTSMAQLMHNTARRRRERREECVIKLVRYSNFILILNTKKNFTSRLDATGEGNLSVRLCRFLLQGRGGDPGPLFLGNPVGGRNSPCHIYVDFDTMERETSPFICGEHGRGEKSSPSSLALTQRGATRCGEKSSPSSLVDATGRETSLLCLSVFRYNGGEQFSLSCFSSSLYYLTFLIPLTLLCACTT